MVFGGRLDSQKFFCLGGRSLNDPTHWMFRVWFRSWFCVSPIVIMVSQRLPSPSASVLGGPRGQGTGGSDPRFLCGWAAQKPLHRSEPLLRTSGGRSRPPLDLGKENPASIDSRDAASRPEPFRASKNSLKLASSEPCVPLKSHRSGCCRHPSCPMV
jgi:hypothetical protein